MDEYKKQENAVRYLRKWNIKKRLRAAFIFTTIIPLILLGVFCAINYWNDVNEKLTDTFVQIMRGLNKTLDVTAERYLNYSYPIITSDGINMALQDHEAKEGHKSLDRILGESGIDDYLWIGECDNMLLYDNELEKVSSMGGVAPEESGIAAIIKELERSGANHVWRYAKNEIGGNSTVFVKKIYSKYTEKEQIGYLVFLFSERSFFRLIYDEVDIGDRADVFVVDENGNYLSSQRDKEKLGTNIEEDISGYQFWTQEKSGKVNMDYRGESSQVIYEYNRKMDVFLVTAVHMSYINQGVVRMLELILMVLAFIIVLCIIIVHFMDRSIVEPIRNLLKFTDAVSAGDYEKEIRDSSEDEMGKLTRYSNAMVKKLVWYMKKIEEDGTERRKLEIQNLQYQIQPHFLFNTLNTFKYIALINNVESLGKGIEALSSLLKNTVNSKEEMIPLTDEVKNIKNYICIQEFRYAGCLNMKYQIEDAAGCHKVPRMLLQPLVENSIVHGMKEDTVLTIWIEAAIREGKLHIVIEDNGAGFAPGKRIQKKQRFSGIGMENIKERIRLIYQEKGDFKVTSKLGYGTSVEIGIPARSIEHV